MPRLVLDSPAVGTTGVGGRRRLSYRIVGQDLPESIWVEVAERDADLLAEDGDWALVAMLYPAMRMGMDLHVDAPVSPRLLDALTRDLQPFLSVYDPRLRPIAVTASDTRVDASPGTLTATGFSAGIDSFATLARYRFGDVHPSLRLTALAVFDVGAFGRRSEPFFSKAVSRAETFAAAHGMRAIGVATNLDAVYRASPVGRPGFERTNTLRNAAAALSLQKGVGRYCISSTFAPAEIGVRPSYNSAYLDPILLPLISTELLTFVSSCCGLTRVEKTRLVASLGEARPLLDVCTRARERADDWPHNCSRCSKCIRTMFTLEHVGRLEDFAAVFDLGMFRKHRERMLAELHGSAAGGNSLDAEVAALMGASPGGRHAEGILGRLGHFLATRIFRNPPNA